MAELETKSAIADVMAAVTELRAEVDAMEKKGAVPDPLIDEKLSKINKTLDAYEGLNQKVTNLEAQTKAQADIDKRFDAIETAIQRRSPGPPAETKARAGDWLRAVVSAYTTGVPNLAQHQQKVLNDVALEFKALNIGTDSDGGYLAPAEYVREIIKGVTEMSPVRTLARVRQTSSKSVEIPTRTGRFSAAMASEMSTRSESTGLTYGLAEIATNEMVAVSDLTNWMIEDAAFSMEAEVAEEATEQFAVKEGQLFVTGTGIGEPEGFMAATGVTTVNSGHATLITADGLLNLKYQGVKTGYMANGTYVMKRATIGAVRTLKDGNGQYLWMPGIAQGKPNTIDGDAYVELPDMPAQGAGLKPVAYGDFRRAYTWVDRIQMTMLRDPFSLAGSGKVRMWMRKRIGGQLVLKEAIATLTCSA